MMGAFATALANNRIKTIENLYKAEVTEDLTDSQDKHIRKKQAARK